MEGLLEQREAAGLLERQRIGAQIHGLRTQLEQSQHRCRSLRCSLLRYMHKVRRCASPPRRPCSPCLSA